MARAELSHDWIGRTLLLYLAALKGDSGKEDRETMNDVVRCWRKSVKPRVKEATDQIFKVLSPRVLLGNIIRDEHSLRRLEAFAFETQLKGGDLLRTRVTAVREGAKTVDLAISKLKASLTRESIQAARTAVEALREGLRSLPESPLIP